MRSFDPADQALADGESARPDSEIRYAMLSVYYHALGRQFQINGAPSVLLPPEARPMSLAQAFVVLRPQAPRFREAIWRTVQAVSPTDPAGIEAYPAAIQPYLLERSLNLEVLNGLRKRYRAGANVFAAALIAFRDGQDQLAGELAALLPGRRNRFSRANVKLAGISATLANLIESSAPDYLNEILGGRNSPNSAEKRAARSQIGKLESEIGLNITDFVESLADVAAFEKFWPDELAAAKWRNYFFMDVTSVYPVCSIVGQNTDDLTTTATVTTIVNGSFDQIWVAVDPKNWWKYSDVVTCTKYVEDPFTLAELTADKPPELDLVDGEGQASWTGPALLRETAEIAWGGNKNQTGTFENVLNVRMKGLTNQFADIEYSLCRSIKSRILWDERAGGLLVNQGFIKIRRIRDGYWRVTMRKEVQFTDRTLAGNGQGPLDFGQMSNYLAPATLTWWLECATYSLSDKPPPSLGCQFVSDGEEPHG